MTTRSHKKNAGHSNPKKMYGKLYATRRRGRPKTRWIDDMSTDLRKTGINERRDRARDREIWRHIVTEAKAHPRLQRHRRRIRRSTHYQAYINVRKNNDLCICCRSPTKSDH
jgi:hypothetical protein